VQLIGKIQSDKRFRDNMGFIFIEGKRNVSDSLRTFYSNLFSTFAPSGVMVDSIFMSRSFYEQSPTMFDEIDEALLKLQKSDIRINSEINSTSTYNSEVGKKNPLTESNSYPPNPPPMYVVDDSIFDARIANTVASQGIAAVVRRPFSNVSLGEWLSQQINSLPVNGNSNDSNNNINKSYDNDSISHLSSPLMSKLHRGPLFVLVLDGVSDPGNVGTVIRSAGAFGADCVVLMAGSCDPWIPKVPL
jgi:tRNA G18 (ribose-2'-O)-methylase SpoU